MCTNTVDNASYCIVHRQRDLQLGIIWDTIDNKVRIGRLKQGTASQGTAVVSDRRHFSMMVNIQLETCSER